MRADMAPSRDWLHMVRRDDVLIVDSDNDGVPKSTVESSRSFVAQRACSAR